MIYCPYSRSEEALQTQYVQAWTTTKRSGFLFLKDVAGFVKRECPAVRLFRLIPGVKLALLVLVYGESSVDNFTLILYTATRVSRGIPGSSR